MQNTTTSVDTHTVAGWKQLEQSLTERWVLTQPALRRLAPKPKHYSTMVHLRSHCESPLLITLKLFTLFNKDHISV